MTKLDEIFSALHATTDIWRAWIISLLMTNYSCLIIHITYIIHIKISLRFSYILSKSMGKLGTLGATIPLVSQKESSYGMGSLWICFERRHHSNKYILNLKFLHQFMYKYVPHSGYIFVYTISKIIFSCLKFLHLPQYNNVLQSWHHNVDTMKKSLFLGKGGIASWISRFIHPS